MREFWKDRVLPHTVEVDEIVIPILEDALQKKAEKAAAGIAESKGVLEEDTLLSCLVKVTDGMSSSDNQCELFWAHYFGTSTLYVTD